MWHKAQTMPATKKKCSRHKHRLRNFVIVGKDVIEREQSNGHDFLVLGSQQFFHFLYHLVVDFLQVSLCVFLNVF